MALFDCFSTSKIPHGYLIASLHRITWIVPFDGNGHFMEFLRVNSFTIWWFYACILINLFDSFSHFETFLHRYKHWAVSVSLPYIVLFQVAVKLTTSL